MKEEVAISTQRAIGQFKDAWFKGMESLLNASKIYVDAIDSNEKAKELFQLEFPKISSMAWGRIESVGRGQMHYLLLCDTSPAAEKIRKLPFSEQKKAIDIGCEVLIDNGESLVVKSENLTPELVKRVIAKDHIRTLAEQRALIESEKIKPKAQSLKAPLRWRKVRGGIDIPAGIYSREELVQMLADLG